MGPTEPRNARDYLRGLVRVDIRKKQKGLDRFQARPGQSAEEAAEIKAKFERDLEFRVRVLTELEDGTLAGPPVNKSARSFVKTAIDNLSDSG